MEKKREITEEEEEEEERERGKKAQKNRINNTLFVNEQTNKQTNKKTERAPRMLVSQQQKNRRLRRQRALVLCWFFATVVFIHAFVPKQSFIRHESQFHSHGKNVLTLDALSLSNVFRFRGRRPESSLSSSNDELRLQMEKEKSVGDVKI